MILRNKGSLFENANLTQEWETKQKKRGELINIIG